LVNNLTLAGYLCGRLSETEALDTARSVWQVSGANNDGPLLLSNVAYYLARQRRHVEAVELLQTFFENLLGRPSVDSYYTYFVGNNLCGSLFMCGRTAESEHLWRTITPFVSDFIGPAAAYLRKRHEMQSQMFLAGNSFRDWDDYIDTAASPQVGPGWKFYGKGFLAAELEYWSDE
jgi:hypothetical protein